LIALLLCSSGLALISFCLVSVRRDEGDQPVEEE
jgi:hypothetical protein